MADVLCSLYDKKALVFTSPVAYPDSATAVRAFISLLGLGDSTPAQWPDDFDLYIVGDFDRNTAVVSGRVPSIILTGSSAVAQLHALRRKEGGGAVRGTGVPLEDSEASAERNATLIAQSSPGTDYTPDLGL